MRRRALLRGSWLAPPRHFLALLGRGLCARLPLRRGRVGIALLLRRPRRRLLARLLLRTGLRAVVGAGAFLRALFAGLCAFTPLLRLGLLAGL